MHSDCLFQGLILTRRYGAVVRDYVALVRDKQADGTLLDRGRPIAATAEQRAVNSGWRWADVHGEELTKERLSGALTKLAAYRGTHHALWLWRTM